MRRRLTSLIGFVVMAALVALPASGTVTGTPRFVVEWGEFGSGDGDFTNPNAIAIGGLDHNIFVTDTGNNRVQIFSPTGDYLDQWGETGSGNGEFLAPSGIAVGNNLVYVADSANDRVQYFTTSGSYAGQWGGGGTGDGFFDLPTGVAVAPNGTVYVTDSSNHRVQYFTSSGTFIDEWGASGTGDGQFSFPFFIAVAPDGTVYVADEGNDRVQYFSATGTYLGQWSVADAVGVAVGADGTVYATHFDNDLVSVHSPTGSLLTSWGDTGTGESEFNQPAGLAVDQWHRVYVADNQNQRLQKFVFPQVLRAAGANRYATAAAVSQLHHPGGDTFGTVFAATGSTFPDALAGGTLLSGIDSLLLTSSIPAATEAELHRLSPEDIRILGGEAAVDAATATALEAWGNVVRLSGNNRYLTAIAISEEGWTGTADTVIVATGTGFADALAGVPLSHAEDAPILLTPPNALDGAVAARINALAPSQIYVLGGSGAVSDAVVTALGALPGSPTVTRLFGSNRYLTAIAISQHAFPSGSDFVYIAVGTNFPDALAGAGFAGLNHSPILLSPTASLPAEVITEIERLDPHTIIILGGTSAISTTVEDQLEDLLGL